MLPPIHISLPLIFILWCIASYFAFDGPVMLFYPAMWGVVALLFIILHFVVASRGKQDSN